MRARGASVLIVVSLIAGCGGGGGGSGSGGGETPAEETPPAGGGTGSSGGGGSTGAGSAEIVFPRQKSAALDSVVVVRGTASDPDGVAVVRIDGVDAVLSSLQAGGTSSSKAAPGQRLQAASDGALMSSHEPTEVEWEVEIELEPGENELEVTVEDAEGDVTAEAGGATIKFVEVPSQFASDADDPRLVGWSTLTESRGVTRLVSFDIATRQQTIYENFVDIGIAGCLRSTTDEYLYVVQPDPGVWQVRSLNLTIGQTSVVAELPPALIDPGPGFSQGPLLIQLVCGGAHSSAYMLANYWEQGDAVKSRILEIDSAGSVSTLTETDAAESPPWLAYKIDLAEDALVSVYDISPEAPLTRISLDGERSELAPTIDVGALAMAAALQQERVYATTFDGVDEVRLTEPPAKENISPVEPDHPLPFSQANSIGIDRVNNRIIVGDTDLDILIAVDLATGERSELLSRKVGAGAPLITPRRLALTADDARAYVLDDGQNAPERLFEVDLATGDRRAVGTINTDGINRSVTGLALDEEGGHIYVARYDGGTVLQVDMATEMVTAITSSGDGFLEGITDLVYDGGGQRLLVVDSVTDAIVAVDVVTHQKRWISRAGDRGAGEAFETPASLTLAEDGAVVYVADQATDRILLVDLETGDREVLDHPCELGGAETLRQVLYDGTAGELLIVADGVFALSLETSVCRQIGDHGLYPLDIRLTQGGQILGADFNAVTQIDRLSGDVVLISK